MTSSVKALPGSRLPVASRQDRRNPTLSGGRNRKDHRGGLIRSAKVAAERGDSNGL